MQREKRESLLTGGDLFSEFGVCFKAKTSCVVSQTYFTLVKLLSLLVYWLIKM